MVDTVHVAPAATVRADSAKMRDLRPPLVRTYR
jgi:hypothetical protein